ncbi:hypothetical protein ES702_02694 [subsurface metagenome]
MKLVACNKQSLIAEDLKNKFQSITAFKANLLQSIAVK